MQPVLIIILLLAVVIPNISQKVNTTVPSDEYTQDSPSDDDMQDFPGGASIMNHSSSFNLPILMLLFVF